MRNFQDTIEMRRRLFISAFLIYMTVPLSFTTQKVYVCSSWTACSVFDWKYLLWENLVQKLKVVSLSRTFVPTIVDKIFGTK